jgi:hypothetical protein
MTSTTIILVNVLLSILVLAAVGGLAHLAHRLPSAAPDDDEDWGRRPDVWVASEPLPLNQVARHETARTLALAA